MCNWGKVSGGWRSRLLLDCVDVCVLCGQSGEILKKAKEHTKQINDIQTSVDLTMFISASKDNTAKVRPLSTLIHTVVVILVTCSVTVRWWLVLFTHCESRVCCWWSAVFCVPSAVWLHLSGSHQDLQDRETCQLCCHLPHHGPRKSKFSQHYMYPTMSQLCDKICAVVIVLLQKSSSSHLWHLCMIQVVMGGGQEAMEVTTTSTRIGKFEARWGY